ncbi:hypothetical protein CesoFtcFv8_009663 [Champsocephalus esox]|uniref:Uncharacterized protein n=1 Tax=Champsocephalus esox TaxID=159716 RepID=A0AAN8C4A2_9TELE|nr:hypothetical protein CesoFtcFv8_009663 [Champsocephalus esox]
MRRPQTKWFKKIIKVQSLHVLRASMSSEPPCPQSLHVLRASMSSEPGLLQQPLSGGSGSCSSPSPAGRAPPAAPLRRVGLLQQPLSGGSGSSSSPRTTRRLAYKHVHTRKSN